MLVKEFPISGASTVNRFVVPTVYKFLTVFNNSTHELVFTDDTDVNNRFMHFAVSPFQYVTYPLDMMGTVASCKRTQSFVMHSIERIVKTPFFIAFPNVRLLFSEENFNVNNYQQAHSQVNVHVPEPVTPVDIVRSSWCVRGSSAANTVLTLTSPAAVGRIQVVTAFEVICESSTSARSEVLIRGSGIGWEANEWLTIFAVGEPSGSRKGATGLMLRGGHGTPQQLTAGAGGVGVVISASLHGYSIPV